MTRQLPRNAYYFFWSALFLYAFALKAQSPVEKFNAGLFDDASYLVYATKKKIPEDIRKQVLIALSFYPELKDTKLHFRFRKRTTPLTSRPRIFSIFRKKKNRAYVITISTKSKARLSPILFENLPYNAQIGVLGHELGHIAYYKTKNSFQILGLSFKILKPKFVDSFEFNTDKIAIDHGLGYQLYDWSVFVRKALNIREWKGASEDGITSKSQRYMNPITIQKYMDENPIYSKK